MNEFGGLEATKEGYHVVLERGVYVVCRIKKSSREIRFVARVWLENETTRKP